ncbi:MAG: PRC-barrel domain-containing protein, partial [Desulfobacteraceae bacterium]|nr:PRC-barrel domain-containing protein [Desulfobacteraceae bacterium]
KAKGGAESPPKSQRFDYTLVHSAKFAGKTVDSVDGRKVGKVSQVLFDNKTGQIRYVAVRSPGPSGKAVNRLVPWAAVKTTSKGTLALNVSAAQFKSAPTGLAIKDVDRAEQLNMFYGVAPYWKETGEKKR